MKRRSNLIQSITKPITTVLGKNEQYEEAILKQVIKLQPVCGGSE